MLYVWAALENIYKLYLVQNAVAFVVLDAPQYIHVIPLLCELPAGFGVLFKMLKLSLKPYSAWDQVTYGTVFLAVDFCSSHQIGQSEHALVPIGEAVLFGVC